MLRFKFNKVPKFMWFLILPFLLLFIFTLLLLFDSEILFISSKAREEDDSRYNTEEVIEYREVNKSTIPSSSGATNGSGLNLLLINDIKTEGYVKELLSMYRDSEQGLIYDNPIHASLGTLLGMQCNETGTYSINGNNLPIVKSYIPIVDNKINWGKDYGTIDGSLMKLNQINHNVINTLQPESSSCNFYNPSYLPGKLNYNINGLNPISGSDAWRDINAFQVRYKYFGIYGGSQKPSKLNGYNENTGRVSDPYFLPDNLANVDSQLVSYCDLLGVNYSVAKNPNVQSTMLSIGHNAGQWALAWDTTFGAFGNGSDWKYIKNPKNDTSVRSEYEKSILSVANSFSKCFEPAKGKMFSAPMDKAATALLLISDGWKINQDCYNYINNSCNSSCLQSVYKILFNENKPADEIRSILKGAVSEYPFSDTDCSNVYGYKKGSNMKSIGGSIFKVEGYTSTVYKNKMSDGSVPKVVHRMPYLSAAHVLSSMCNGNYIYGAMLKYAGVGVDPTNPDTYINNLPSGEWKPSGGSSWLDKEGVDSSTLSEKRLKVLNTGHLYLGSPYTWGGTQPPKKNISGKWIGPGFDCSGFTQYCYSKVGISIGRNTWAQFASSNTYEISKSELKPGDLVMRRSNGGSEHVGIFIKFNKNGELVMMHSPQTGDVVKIAVYRTANTYLRVKGVDN